MLAVRFAKISEKGECTDFHTKQFEKESEALNYLWNELPSGWKILFTKEYE